MARKQASRLYDVWRAPLLTWLALCLALAVTCFVAYLPLGRFNMPISLVIAGVKAALVGAVFMRLSEGNSLHRLAAGAGPLWVFIMFLLMGADYFTR